MPVLAIVCVLSGAAVPARAEEAGDDGVRVHEVSRGQVLGAIARRYGVSVEAICRASAISPRAPIKPGQRLIIPAPYRVLRNQATARSESAKDKGASRKSEGSAQPSERKKKTAPARRAVSVLSRQSHASKSQSWTPYVKAAWRRGYVTLYGHGKRWQGYVIGPKEQVLPLARRRISEALASWRTGAHVLLDERLVRLIAEVSDTFGGRPIRVVSGYRERSYAPDSKHKLGRAFDFSIPGVPNEALRDYLRSLPRVGVGFYPNSTHVHLDVRQQSGYWIDYSRPGQRPVYAHERRISANQPLRDLPREVQPGSPLPCASKPPSASPGAPC